jgi:FkbM family methyltransferase
MVVPGFNLDVAVGVVRDGVIEPWTTRLIQELVRPGQVVINGGANFGYYAVLTGQIVGADGLVIAVEANPHVVPYLLLTRHWSGLTGRMEIFQRALWDREGVLLQFTFDPQFLGGGAADLVRDPAESNVVGREIGDVLWSAGTLVNITDGNGRIDCGRQMHVTIVASTTTIDSIAPKDRPVDLIHLDIEGAEAFALLGAQEVIRRSPGIKLVTEWSAKRTSIGDETRNAAARLWDVLEQEGFRVRHLLPTLAENGGIFVSDHLSREHMMTDAEHGDYVWCRDGQDPWS